MVSFNRCFGHHSIFSVNIGFIINFTILCENTISPVFIASGQVIQLQHFTNREFVFLF